MATHPVSGKAYVVTFLVLLALTALTFGLHFVPLGVFGTVVAFAIATAKVLLVVLYFMHLRETGFVVHLAALTLVMFLAFICLGVAADVLTR